MDWFMGGGMIVLAIITFVKGKLQISHRWVVSGTPAYVAAAILLFPLPCSIGAAILAALFVMSQGQFVDPADFERWLRQHEVALSVFALSIQVMLICVAFTIAVTGARDPAEIEDEERRRDAEERRRRDRWDDDLEHEGRY